MTLIRAVSTPFVTIIRTELDVHVHPTTEAILIPRVGRNASSTPNVRVANRALAIDASILVRVRAD